jgi:nucleotide-binding universal stress UspA family protein
MHKAQSVTVVTVVEERPVEEQALLGQDALEHLKHHGINATLHQVVAKSRDAAAIILSEATRRKADLIVMGGYGHSRLREFILGGATRGILESMTVPIFMSH